ncbi:MAG: serine/threonine-protein kinase [Phycisphaerales bacterium JB054]
MPDPRMEDTRSRQAPDDRLTRIASASPHMEDELLAERIEHDLGQQGSVVPAMSLSGLIGAIPLLRSRPIALDAAIDVVVKGMLARGRSPQEIEAALLEDSPEFADSIRAHMALRAMLTSSNPVVATNTRTSLGALPVSFGPELPDGQRRYELVENVGGGSEGSVYRAFDRQISTGDRPLQVAVKILHSRGDAVPVRVIDEVARVMRVRHPAVVSLLNWERDYEQPFLVYEFIEGESLDRWRKTRPRPSCREIATMVRRLAEGVQAIHSAGVAHRDIKPNNIIVDRHGAAFITDFGLADEIAARASLRSGGSLAFAAPEQLQGEPGSSGNAVDVYALGGVLYWLLTGSYPNGATSREVQQHVTSRTELPEVDRSRYGRGEFTLHQIARRALAPDPADRHSSADALATDLGRWLAYEPVVPFDDSVARRAALATRRSPMAVVAAGGLLLATVVTMWSAWRLDAQKAESRFTMERQRYQLELQQRQQLLEQRTRRMEEAQQITREFAQTARRFLNKDGDTSWLAMFSSLESLSSKGALAIPGVGAELVQGRIALMSDLLHDADQAGTRNSVENALWESALVYWLLRAERFEEAAALGDQNTARLVGLVPADDPWTIVAGALSRTARLHLQPGDDRADADRRWLEEHREQLPSEVLELTATVLARS